MSCSAWPRLLPEFTTFSRNASAYPRAGASRGWPRGPAAEVRAGRRGYRQGPRPAGVPDPHRCRRHLGLRGRSQSRPSDAVSMPAGHRRHASSSRPRRVIHLRRRKPLPSSVDYHPPGSLPAIDVQPQVAVGEERPLLALPANRPISVASQARDPPLASLPLVPGLSLAAVTRRRRPARVAPRGGSGTVAAAAQAPARQWLYRIDYRAVISSINDPSGLQIKQHSYRHPLFDPPVQ